MKRHESPNGDNSELFGDLGLGEQAGSLGDISAQNKERDMLTTRERFVLGVERHSDSIGAGLTAIGIATAVAILRRNHGPQPGPAHS